MESLRDRENTITYAKVQSGSFVNKLFCHKSIQPYARGGQYLVFCSPPSNATTPPSNKYANNQKQTNFHVKHSQLMIV